MSLEVTNDEFQEWVKAFDARADDVANEKAKLYQEAVEAREKFGPEFVSLLWRIARVGYQAACDAELKQDKENQLSLLKEAEKWAKLSLDKDPNCSDAHSWYAAICGKLTSFVGPRERIEKAKLIQVHLEEAIKLNATDAALYYSYGRWCIEIAKLSWIEKKLASAVFERIPDVSYQDAIKQFQKAEELRPNWKTPNYYMGYCYACLKDYKEAIKHLDFASNCPVNDDEDKLIEKETLDLQKKYAKYR